MYTSPRVSCPGVFLFGKKKSEKEKKAEFHRKVRSMDIQDAEYEDK